MSRSAAPFRVRWSEGPTPEIFPASRDTTRTRIEALGRGAPVAWPSPSDFLMASSRVNLILKGWSGSQSGRDDGGEPLLRGRQAAEMTPDTSSPLAQLGRSLTVPKDSSETC